MKSLTAQMLAQRTVMSIAIGGKAKIPVESGGRLAGFELLRYNIILE
jgi:hypothetical protein